MVPLGTPSVRFTNESAITTNFEGDVRYCGARTEIFSEILAIFAANDLSVIDATGQVHRLSDLELQSDEVEHSPTLRQVDGALRGLRVIRGGNTFSAKFYTWTGHRVCFLDDEQCVKTIDLDDSGSECPEIECATFCPERGYLVIGDNYRTLRLTIFCFTNNRVIDIENEIEIWAEEIESDYEYEFEEGYDGALLDLDIQLINEQSTFSLERLKISVHNKCLARPYGVDSLWSRYLASYTYSE